MADPLVDILPPVASDDFIPAVRALIERRLRAEIQACHDQCDDELLYGRPIEQDTTDG